MEKKQSSVEWLEIELQNLWLKKYLSANTIKSLFEQAKAMHKEEVQDAYRISPNNELWSNSGIDYYNETFGGKSFQSSGTSNQIDRTITATNGGNNE